MNVTFALENWSIWCCIKSSVPPLAVSAAIAERFTSSLNFMRLPLSLRGGSPAFAPRPDFDLPADYARRHREDKGPPMGPSYAGCSAFREICRGERGSRNILLSGLAANMVEYAICCRRPSS